MPVHCRPREPLAALVRDVVVDVSLHLIEAHPAESRVEVVSLDARHRV